MHSCWAVATIVISKTFSSSQTEPLHPLNANPTPARSPGAHRVTLVNRELDAPGTSHGCAHAAWSRLTSLSLTSSRSTPHCGASELTSLVRLSNTLCTVPLSIVCRWTLGSCPFGCCEQISSQAPVFASFGDTPGSGLAESHGDPSPRPQRTA